MVNSKLKPVSSNSGSECKEHGPKQGSFHVDGWCLGAGYETDNFGHVLFGMLPCCFDSIWF